MKELMVHQQKLAGENIESLIALCPFGAIEYTENELAITAGCKMCGVCVKKGPEGLFEIIEKGIEPATDPGSWKGIAVYLEQEEGRIHPVGFELLGKARELAAKSGDQVIVLCIGSGISRLAEEALEYGADRLYLYDQKAFEHFRIEPYAAAFEDFIGEVKPSVCLVGGTVTGRSLAPRVAARFRTGLTADCTILDINELSELDQIRPAFGGNIMAHIHTPNCRPQFATVRYKMFSRPEKCVCPNPAERIEKRSLPTEKVSSRIEVLEVKPKERVKGLEEADIIVVAGRGLKRKEDLAMLRELAELLGAEMAGTRTLIEEGWLDPRRQIGLSGRTVKPKLIITCGVSGAIQFVAGMNGSETIIAVNSDANAPIMKVAHTAVNGDIYEILPRLIEKIKERSCVPA